MNPDERDEFNALLARVEKLENLMAHQAGLSIVLYNGLLQASNLMLDVARVSSPLPINPLRGEDSQERAKLGREVHAEMVQLGETLKDLFSRLEPMRDFLTEAD